MRKAHFYYIALVLGLLSAVPYIVCIGFHISKKEDKVQKVEIVKYENKGNLRKIDSMANDSNTRNGSETNASNHSTTTTTQTTRLPGVDNARIIDSSPNLVKENSPKITTREH